MPQTYGDYIRTLSDEQLAELFTALLSSQRHRIIEQLQAMGIPLSVGIVEMPELSKAGHLEWLKMQMEE